MKGGENMAQAIAIQGVDIRPGLREIMEQNAVQPACADAFFLLMQQMLAQGQSTDMLLTQMKNEAEKDSEEIGAQTASEMLYMLPYAQLFPTLQTSSSLSEIAQYAASPSPSNSVLELYASLTNHIDASAGMTEAMDAEVFGSILQGSWKERMAQTETEGLSWQSDVLREAKQMLSQKQEEITLPVVDVESLQADVDSGRFFHTEAILQKQSMEFPTFEQISTQVKDGLLDNIAQGKNEFVIRLKPEGIGEVVVKLSENREKIELNIFTSSIQTAKLIEGEVAALQNALRPLQAEVQQISVMPEEYELAYAAQNAMTGREQHSQNRGFTGQEKTMSDGRQTEKTGFSDVVQNIILDDGLDTYI